MILVCRDPLFVEHCRSLARQFAWSLMEREPASGIYLSFSQGALELRRGGSRSGPVRVDFLKGELAHLARRGIGKSDLFAKAIGVRRGVKRVIDATAGLGHDTFMLLLVGCDVTAIERSPVVFALLADGLRRAELDAEWNAKFGGRLRLVHQDAVEYLRALKLNSGVERPDAVYIDPMFPEKKKSAASSLEMQMLRELLGIDDVSELIQAAREVAIQRVVLKRPLRAAASDPKPSLVYSGRSVRYDVWS